MSSFLLLINLAARNLLRNPRRTFAVLLTVAIGTGSLFTFEGFNHGIMNQYRINSIHSRLGYGQINTRGYRDKVHEKPWEHWIENPAPTLEEVRKIPGVTHVFPRLNFYSLISNGAVTLSGRGQGINGAEEADFFHALNIVEGETLKHQPDGILLGKGLAHTLNVKPGDRVTVLANTVHGSMNGADLTVIGVFHTGAKEFDDLVYRIPLKVAQTLLDTDRIESISLGLKDVDTWKPVAAAVEGRHPELEAIPFAVLDKVYYQNAVDWLESQFSVIRLIFLLIVVLGIFNTISTGILERKQEVGNLRANGESRGQILALFLTEGAALGILGSLAGVLLAAILAYTVLRHGILMPPSPGLTRQFNVFVELTIKSGLITFVLGVACAFLGTLLAAFKVTRLPIGEALRSV